MWVFISALALVSAEHVAVDADGSLDCEGDEVCLLQTSHFMRKHGLGNNEAHAGECPGKLVTESAQQGKCSYTGVELLVGDGTSITDFFDDNVQMKDFHWYINGIKNVWVQLETHPFRVGSTVVTVEGRDLAGNTRSCHRTVTVKDTQKPKWTVDPSSVDKEVTMYVDKSCTRTATSMFAEYESIGWVASGEDNCEIEGVTRQVKKDGAVLYDDSGDGDLEDLLKGPGTYEVIYTLTDVNGLTNRHTVVVHLEDNIPPTKIAGCPEDEVGTPGAEGPAVFVEVAPNATDGTATWTVPYVVEDNCLEYGKPPVPQEVNLVGHTAGGNSTATLTVGDTKIAYPVADAFGNLYQEECTFVVTVTPQAHPVKLTCPPDVVVNTFELAPFGAPNWDAPVATQGNETLDASHITYLHGAGPERPFPYGETTVTAKATGKITGTRTNEAEQSDECSFRVKVNDPFRPYVDGRHFRCMAESEGVEPYGVCDGTDLHVSLHPGYEDTGGYDLESAVAVANKTCCGDEMGAAYTCQPGASPLFKYCQPA